MAEKKQYYGIIGNGETIALVSPKASIDWLCLPQFDGKLVYAKALDPVNGKALALQFLNGGKVLLLQKSRQVYIPKTNILETHLEFKGFHVCVTDFMPWKGISEILEDKRIIFRLVKIKNLTNGKAKVVVNAISGVGTESGYAELADGAIFFKEKGLAIGSVIKSNKMIINAGSESFCWVAIVYGQFGKEVIGKIKKLRFTNPKNELQIAERFWKNWLSRGKSPKFSNKEYEQAYCRSLLLIKLLSYDKTGAVLAAPTASFPATPGGSENWDYRFMWIRDSFFAGRALLKAGHPEEVKEQLELFYKIQMQNGHWALPFYTIRGDEPGSEIIVEGLKGPHGEDSIRLNNEAKDQLQLDSEGSVLHLTYLYYSNTNDKDFLKKYWNNIKRTANWITRNYDRAENGLWELREHEHKALAHWTYGKVMCWVGLVSAIEIAEKLGMKVPDEWYVTERNIERVIFKEAWSEQRKAFVQTYDDDSQMDISVLSIEDFGLLSPFHPKMHTTVREMERCLVTEGNGVKRFEDAVIPFYLPTLWLSQHFVRVGNKEKAKKYINAALSGSTDLYLCAEHFDPITGMQHGNFPQTFSAAAFVEVLTDFTEAKRFKLLEKLNMTLKETFRYISEI